MAKEDEQSFRGLMTSWPALAALAVTMFSFVAASPRLESPRPSGRVAAVPKLRIQDPELPARLWQDPLGSMALAPKQDDDKVLARDMPAGPSGRKILVLLNFIEPDTTPEVVETRRRERYATLSAMNTAGYAPVKQDRLYYVDLNYTDQDKEATKRSQNYFPSLEKGQVRLPFEWMAPMDGPHEGKQPRVYAGICVGWLYDFNAVNILRLLAHLKKQIRIALGASVQCEFAVAGRIVSARLQRMIKHDDDFHEPEGLEGATLYVTNSTASFVRTFDRDPETPLKNSKLRRKYVIGSDNLLFDALVDELEQRGISTKDGHLAIISEWDTMYGRSMPGEFAAAVERRTGSPPAQVKLASYLRGLDGKLPGKVDDDKDQKILKPGEAEKPTASSGEGDSQLDYLRRLVERMQAERKSFRAIGILGSDVYDKLLILKAMRASFPEALFFTTDLDARMLQAAETDWTRNLVIAAHFGPVLNKELQGKIPPFRSSYDTASYLGCLLAIGHAPLKRETEVLKSRAEIAAGAHLLVIGKDGTGLPLPVHRYEVGRYGAFELSIHDETEDPLGARNHQRDREYWLGHRGRIIGVALACAVLLGLLLLTVSRTWQRLLGLQPPERIDDGAVTPWRWRGPFFGLALAATLVVTAGILFSHHHPQHEPFSMVEGISVWPTVLFRLAAIGLSVYYIFKTMEELAALDKKITDEFFSEAPAAVADSTTPSSWWRERMWFWNPSNDQDVQVVWRQFQTLGGFWHRAARCGLVFLANLLIFLALWSMADALRFRGRGPLAYWSTRLSLDIAGILLVLLLVFVVDTTVLCYRFVTYLSRYRGAWPALPVRTQTEARGLSGVPEAALNEFLRMRLIASTTRVAADLIFDPFVVLFLLFVAQNPLFVTWQWNVPALTVAFLSLGAALGCALILQRTAKAAQRKALDKLDALLLPFAGKDNDETRGKLVQIRSDIDDMDSGVFAGFINNPVLYALLLPLGGGGGLAALEALLPHL